MVQWFCFISWRLFDGGILYLGWWISVTQRLASLNWCGSLTYISWSSEFALYLDDYLMDEGHTWCNRSVWHKDWPHKIYIGQWPIFCISDFTLYFEGYLMDEHHIWANGSVWHKHWPHKVYAGQWSIFHGPVILPYILTINCKLFW